MKWTRRKWLQWSAATAVGVVAGCGKDKPAAKATPKAGRAADLKPDNAAKASDKPVTDPEAIATVLLETPRPKICDRVAQLLANGSERPAIWRGIHRAMARFEGDVHPRLAAFSMALVARDIPFGHQLLPMMWAADAVKEEQAAGTKAAPMPRVPAPIEKLKRRALIGRLHEAFAKNDAATCSACLRELYGLAGQGVTAEQLYICGARDDRNGGHGTMYAVQGLRVLDACEWRHAEPMIDAMMRHMLPPLTGQAPPGPDAIAAYDKQRERAARLASVNAKKGRDDAQARAILHAARTLDGEGLADEIGRRWLTGKVPAASMWDGLMLAAGEQALNDPSGARRGLHAFDTLNVLHVASMRAASPRTRVLLLLMAARRLPGFRTGITASPQVPIDKLPNAKAITGSTPTAKVLEDAKGLGTVDERAMVASKIAAYITAGGDRHALKNAIRQRVVERAGMDWHRVKYPAAVLEEEAYAGAWAQPMILAATVGCLPGKDAKAWSALRGAQAAIKKLRS